MMKNQYELKNQRFFHLEKFLMKQKMQKVENFFLNFIY